MNRTPPTSLSTNVHYERMMEMFNIKGHFCVDIPQLQRALQQSLQVNRIFLLWYIMINLGTYGSMENSMKLYVL
jgi:hypothetical protein